MDAWASNFTSMGGKEITPELLEIFQGGDYDVHKDELRNTYVGEKKGVAWQSWGGAAVGAEIGSSMLIPVTPVNPAVGGKEYLCRCVLTTCFPAFCYLLGAHFTANELEVAWNKLPLVKPGKANRGCPSPGAGKRHKKWTEWW